MIRVLYTGTRAPTHTPAGLDLVHLPVLRTQSLLGHGEKGPLTRWLTQPHQLLFFSRHAITAFAQALLPITHARYVWCVGEKTARRVAKTWPELAHKVMKAPAAQQHYEGVIGAIAHTHDTSPLIVAGLQGATRPVSQDLRELLGVDTPHVHHVDAYRTVVRDDLEVVMHTQLLTDLDWVLCASPRAVMACAPLLRHHRARLAAIGHTTAHAIEEAGLRCELIASSPSLDTLLANVLAH